MVRPKNPRTIIGLHRVLWHLYCRHHMPFLRKNLEAMHSECNQNRGFAITCQVGCLQCTKSNQGYCHLLCPKKVLSSNLLEQRTIMLIAFCCQTTNLTLTAVRGIVQPLERQL